MLPPNKTPAPSRSVAVLAVLAGLAVLLSCCVAPLRAQENAQLQIPPSLLECYNTSFFMNRDNRLPSTMETLISLIEKVENSPNFNLDIRQLAVALLHRFRQDGIQQASGVSATPGVLPYSPTGYQFPKFRILLSRLIPGNALTFPNSSLTREERCSMHFMLSSSIDSRVRGDESTVCSQLSQYRAQRLPRDVGNNFVGDVELLGEQARRDGQPRAAGQQQMWPPRTKTNGKAYADFDYWSESDYGTVDSSVSQCPVENGVVKTSWGTVAAGPLIAGIAAGLQPQLVQLRTLLAMSSRRGGSFNAPQTATVSVDNRWAATLSGDLAEVTLVQVPTSGQPSSATVGANGAWNSTVMPKWYFLSQRQDLEMTDAEIRGGLDGLILGMNVSTWRTQASSLKLSQLLRMYYSMDGVLGSGIMACNRKEQFATVAPLTEMIAQTSAFAQVLDGEMQLRVTLTPAAIAQFATLSANALTAYIPQYLNDVSCSVSNALPQDVSESITAMTDIYVFLDTSWQYYDVVNYVNYVIDGLNINPYASSVTLLAAADGSVIVNRTHYISDLYRHWNVTTHSWYTPGFNLPTVLRTIQNLTQSLMAEEKANSSLSGHSLVALLVPYTATVSDADSSYSTTALQYINEQVPDLRFVYYAGGTITRFSSFVQDPSQDLFALSIGTDVAAASGPVLRRIKKIPRRIINPRCGYTWYTPSWGTDSLAQYARPGVINFYRVAPNYFYGAGSGRFVNIQSTNSLSFTVCSSRSVALPMQNATTSSGSSSSDQPACVQLSSNTFSYDLSSACNDYPTIHQCPPLYLSVQAASASSSLTVSCSDDACQTPDQAKYTISVVNMGCYSGVGGLLASLALVAAASLLRQLLQ